MSATFTGPGGLDPLAAFAQLRARAAITAGDGIAAGQALRTDIRDDTANGIDAEGQLFPAYVDSYAKYKAKRGRNTTVDLFGARQNSHMLNAILVKAGGAESSGNDTGSNYAMTPITEIRVGIYSEDEAARARVHNEGLGHQPRRHFFDASAPRVATMERIIGQRVEERLRNG
jgi:hypothetical protein